MMQKKAVGRVAMGMLLVFMATYLLFNAQKASSAALLGLSLSVHTVVPGVFPYLVLGSLFVRLGMADVLGRYMHAFMKRFFALPGCCGGVLLLGLLCGFPTGANMTVSLYKRGSITKEQAERLIAFCNFCGPSYIFLILGGKVWHSTGKALFFFVFQCALALFLGMLLGRGKKTENGNGVWISSQPFSRAFTESIPHACGACLGICGYITFFTVFLSAVSGWLADVTPSVLALLCGFFEMSTGVSKLIGEEAGASLAPLIVLWSGVSVFMQIQSIGIVSDTERLSMHLYWRVRGLSLLCGCVLLMFWDKI